MATGLKSETSAFVDLVDRNNPGKFHENPRLGVPHPILMFLVVIENWLKM